MVLVVVLARQVFVLAAGIMLARLSSPWVSTMFSATASSINWSWGCVISLIDSDAQLAKTKKGALPLFLFAGIGRQRAS